MKKIEASGEMEDDRKEFVYMDDMKKTGIENIRELQSLRSLMMLGQFNQKEYDKIDTQIKTIKSLLGIKRLS